ncbi:TonB-dependent receptor [Algoriphagus chordae]|uniref:Outer membrane receptor protein involved in Fe transport n=1 Tax=Algoriphagus chordae TaxID=237019 RepID=A0A2W7RFU6_9BACT|nr:TonB-dependent receptor [Algoriphagus chordae]PZX49585.1 outer membrane receptor protein involved in Fe transport [Algoriphagus chordae]
MFDLSTRRIIIFLGIFLLNFTALIAQTQEEINALVMDVTNSEPLLGATVYWENEISSGVISDLDGRFSLKSSSFPRKIVISYIGYKTSIRTINKGDTAKELKFYLEPEDLSLDEIVIQARNPDAQIKSLETGKVTVPMATLRTIPALFGEVDLLRGLQLLPGVQSAGEGTTGLFVRGGSADQNLIQLDGAPVYNAAHFFGFFSVFNPDALSGVDLYKGNMPASYGGRLSSLIDVGLKEGNNEQIRGTGGIGSISSRLTLDGPLFSDKSTFIISGRRTYADLGLKFVGNEDISNNKLNFHDLSGKLAFRLGDKDKITLSSYQGRDYLGLDEEFGLKYSNWVTSAVWNRNISDKAFFDLNLYHSRYKYGVNFEDPDTGFEWNNKILETGLKGQWRLVNGEKIQTFWGFQSQWYHLAPIDLDPSPNSSIQGINTSPNNALLNNLFVGTTVEFSPKFSSEVGIRWGFYNQVGKGTEYIYQDGIASIDSPITDTLNFSTLQNMKFYQGLEPRVAFRYMINTSSSIKAAYNRNFQYLQVASNSSAGLPIDRWIQAGTYIPPIRSDQISLGYFKNFKDNRWEFSVEGYAKNFKNIIDLRNGASVLFTDNVETEILIGDGYAYGLEVLLRKSVGKTTGWLAYTYSRTWRQIDGVSMDVKYNPRYDRPNDLTLVLNHEFNTAWSVGLTFVYATGQAVSFPEGSYQLDNQLVPLYSNYRNTDRYPNYHRMDASVTWKNTQKGRKWRGSWNFSVYNLYGRKNPFSYEFREINNDDIKYNSSEDGPIVSSRPGIVMTYLFTFLPSLTYNFEF